MDNYCGFCKINFKNNILLGIHKKTKIHINNEKGIKKIPPIYNCNSCTYNSYDHSNFKRHIQTHERKSRKFLIAMHQITLESYEDKMQDDNFDFGMTQGAYSVIKRHMENDLKCFKPEFHCQICCNTVKNIPGERPGIICYCGNFTCSD